MSTRYKVRAMSDLMPTVNHEWDKVKEGNAYHYTYGDHIDGGKCSYGSGAQDTMQHIFGECKHTEAVRITCTAVKKVGKLWGARAGGGVRLLEIDYFTQQGGGTAGGEWQRWGWCPRSHGAGWTWGRSNWYWPQRKVWQKQGGAYGTRGTRSSRDRS